MNHARMLLTILIAILALAATTSGVQAQQATPVPSTAEAVTPDGIEGTIAEAVDVIVSLATSDTGTLPAAASICIDAACTTVGDVLGGSPAASLSTTFPSVSVGSHTLSVTGASPYGDVAVPFSIPTGTVEKRLALTLYPSLAPTPTDTPAPTGHVTVVLDTADGGNVPIGTHVCIDTRCIDVDERKPVVTLDFGIFGPGTWPLSIANAAPYEDLATSFDLPQNASTTLGLTLSLPAETPTPTPDGDESAFIVLETEDGGAIPHSATVCVGGQCQQITDAYDTDFYQFALHGFANGQTYPVTVSGIAPYTIGDTFTAMAEDADPAYTITMPAEGEGDGAMLGFTLVRTTAPTPTPTASTTVPVTQEPTAPETPPTAAPTLAITPTSATATSPASASSLPNTGSGPTVGAQSASPFVTLGPAIVAGMLLAVSITFLRATRRR